MTEAQALHHIKKIFKDNLFERRTLSKRGRLETNRLSFFKTSAKLFSEKTGKSEKNYSVEILLDGSKSMFYGPRAEQSFLATKNIISILQYVCDINIRIFNCSEKIISPREFMMLSFSEYEKICSRQIGYETINGLNYITDYREGFNINPLDEAWYGTWEISSMQSAVTRLKKKEGGKIIMLLQDGVTEMRSKFMDKNWVLSGHCWDKYNERTQPDLLKKYKREGIDIVSFLIQTDNPRKQYESAGHKFVEINDANEIYPKMVTYLKTIIK